MSKNPLAALALACALLTACGSETYSGAKPESEAEDPAKLVQECPPIVAKAPASALNQVQPGAEFTADLGDGRQAELTVDGAQIVRSVPDRFGKSGSFRAPADASLLVLNVRFVNRSEESLEAADTIGKSFDVRTDDNLFKRADATEACSTISPSSASEKDKTTSPETDVSKGDGYSTVLVYTVPTADIMKSGLSWASATARVQVPLQIKQSN